MIKLFVDQFRPYKAKTSILTILLFLLFSSPYAHSRDYNVLDYIGDRSSTALTSIGLITLTSALASQNAKATGIGLVVLSPFVGISTFARKGAASGIVSTLAVASLGWYNLDELAKDKYSKTRVFEKDMAIMGSALALGLGLVLEGIKFTGALTPSSNIQLVPNHDGAMLNYSYRF